MGDVLLLFAPSNLHQVREASWEKSYPEWGPPLIESQGHFSLSEAWGGLQGGQIANQDREASESGGGRSEVAGTPNLRVGEKRPPLKSQGPGHLGEVL